MVKVSGFRIKIEEVEKAIYEISYVISAVVLVVFNEDRGTNQLHSFVVVSLGAVAKADVGSNIRSHLSKKLPRYMIPEAIIQIEEMPTNSNGKIDRAKAKQLFIDHLRQP